MIPAVLALALVTQLAPAARREADALPAEVASSGGMLWWHDPEDGSLMAMTASRGVDEPIRVRPLAVAPADMAAAGQSLWCAMSPDGSGTAIYRVEGGASLLSSRLQNPDFGDIELLATLVPSVGALVADGERPLVQESAAGRLLSVVPLGSVPLIVTDSRIHWDTARLVQWPAGDSSGRGWALAWDDETSLVVLTPLAEHDGATSFSMQSIAGAAGWHPVPGARLPTLSSGDVAGRRVASVRDGVLFAIGTFPSDAGVSPVGFLDGGRGGIIAIGNSQAWRMDPVSGDVERVTLSPPGAAAVPAPWWPLPMVGALTVAAVVALVIMRPSRAGIDPRSLPEGWVPLGIAFRALAFGIDAFPVWVLVVLLRGDVELSAWARWPAWAGGADDVGWGLALIGLLTLNSVVQESILGTSMGKRLVGAGVVTLVPGATRVRATPGRAAMRALLRGIVLVAPALVFLTLIDPSMCGLPEVATRTAVARRKPVAPPVAGN